MSDFRFFDSQYLIFILFFVLLYLSYFFLGVFVMEKMKKIFQNNFLFLIQNLSVAKRYFKMFFEFLMFLFLILAFARPQYGKQDENIKVKGVEMVIVFDVSQSMWAEDIKPDRLTFAKRQLLSLIDSLSSHRFGLVVFAGSAFLVSPLTSDKSALRMYIESFSPHMMSHQGTHFRNALEVAASALERSREKSLATSQMILLFSDGEDSSEEALETAKRLSKENTPIFAVAIGTEKGAVIPMKDTSGNTKGYLRDKKGKVVVSRSEASTLKGVAEKSGGKFYAPNQNSLEWTRLKEDIETRKRNVFDSYIKTRYNEFFSIFLILAVLFGILSLSLTDRKNTKIKRKEMKDIFK